METKFFESLKSASKEVVRWPKWKKTGLVLVKKRMEEDFCDICDFALSECNICEAPLCWNCDIECIMCVWEGLDQK